MNIPSGTIRDMEKARQVLMYDGLYMGDGCAPTDIDLSRDYRTLQRGISGHLVVRADAKHGLTPLGEGQDIHVRLDARAYHAISVPYYFVVIRHQVEAPTPVYAKDCRVDMVLENRDWTDQYRGKTFAEFEAILIARHGVIRRTA